MTSDGAPEIAPYSLSVWRDDNNQKWKWSVHVGETVVSNGEGKYFTKSMIQAKQAMDRYLNAQFK